MKLEGSLDQFPLSELIDMVTYSSVTGVLNIYGPGPSGHLFFRDGKLYHAEHGKTQGSDALAEIFAVEQGHFSFVSDITTENESIWGSIDYHLQHAEQAATRWRRIRAYVPHLDLTPRLLIGADRLHQRVNPAHYPVLDLIDGHATLRAIAARLGWAAIDVAEVAAQLSLDGVIALENPPPDHDEKTAPSRAAVPSNTATPSEPSPNASASPAPPSPEEMIVRLLRGSG